MRATSSTTKEGGTPSSSGSSGKGGLADWAGVCVFVCEQ